MLSHEPKNYALLGYDGALLLRGVGFRSSRAEPFGEAFLRRALERLLVGDVAGVHAAYRATLDALQRRALTTLDVSSLVRLTKTPEAYREVRDERRELPYEAVIASGRRSWRAGERVRVYRTSPVSGRLVGDDDPRDYDVEHYARQLRDTFAQRLARAFTPADFDAVFDDPAQLPLFPRPLDSVCTILTPFHATLDG